MQVAVDQSKSIPSLEILTRACASCVQQCQQILELIDENVYVYHAGNSSSVGAHFRHIIERFNCFLAGYPGSRVDYDKRKRDRQLEMSLARANEVLPAITASLTQVRNTDIHSMSVSESVHANLPPVAVESTVQRELMGLVSHTTHHLAIIVLLVKEQGCHLPANLGKAPSTLIYEKNH